MGVDEGRSVVSVERFGPVDSPGPFELGTDGPGVIVAGVDASPTSMRAAAYAAGLARRQGARLVVVYVVSSSVWVAVSPAPVGAVAQELVVELTAQIRETVRVVAEELGVPVTFVVRTGDPFDGVKRTAVESLADLVVVGSSTSAGHRLVGSVANRLVRAGRWPVTVVP